MNIKDIFHQVLKDKDGNFSMREVISLIYVFATLVSWVAQQFFKMAVHENMFYAFISMIGAGSFGYSLERKSKDGKPPQPPV
jgi:hypothetical protein